MAAEDTVQLGTHRDGELEPLACPVEDLCLGLLVVGQQGSGKTYGLKKIVETCSQLPSMRHIVVLDVKGDWSQLLVPNEGAPPAEIAAFEERCDVRIYTFGTEAGWKATLDPFYFSQDDLAALDPTSLDDQHKLDTVIHHLVSDVMTAVGMISIDVDGREVLQDKMLTMPALLKAAGPHGPSNALRASLGEELVDAAFKTCKRYFLRNQQLPPDFGAFADALQQSNEPPDAILPEPSLKQSDLDFAANATRAGAELSARFGMLYHPALGNEAHPSVDDVYPLAPLTLCDDGDKRSGKNVKVSFIRLTDYQDHPKIQQVVVQTVLTRLKRWVPMSGGSQHAPATMIVLDEAHRALPHPRSTRSAVMGSMGVVAQLLKMHRSVGVILALGTHLPQDIDPRVFEFLSGGQFIGRLELTGNLQQVLEKMVRRGKSTNKRTIEGAANSEILEAIRGLRRGEFVIVPKHIEGAGMRVSHRLFRFGELVRHHEDSGPWTRGRERGVIDEAYAACQGQQRD